MRRFDKLRWLSACAVSTALLSAPIALWAQTASTQTLPGPAAADQSLVTVPPPSNENLGDALMAHHRYQAAIEAYKQEPHPSAQVWNKMGIAYQMMFNQIDAMRCYQASLKMEPKDVNTLNNLGTIYDSQKEYKTAVKMYRKALKYDPKSALVLKNLGTDLLAQHQYRKGWEVYQSALAIDPEIFDHSNGPRVENPASSMDRGAMNYYMAKSCARAGNNDRAIEYLRMALNEGFTNPRKIEADQEFARLHGLPAYQMLLAEQVKQ